EQTTCDKSYFRGHFFSNKAPGLALASLPLYAPLAAAGAVPGSPTTAIWVLALWGALAATALLLALVRREAGAVAPGTGTAVALTLGLGTLLLPFSTLFFA